MLNKTVLMGRLVRDPDLRKTNSGVSVVNFTVAVDRDFKGGDKDKAEADFINCIAWRNTADFIAKYFAKGRMIVVSGALRTSSYTNKDGNKISKTEVEVDSCYFADSKTSGRNASNDSNPAQRFEEVSDEDDGDLPF